MAILFNTIRVNGMENNATISIGENREFGWNNNTKSNLGFGSMNGANDLANSIDVVLDNDVAEDITIDLT